MIDQTDFPPPMECGVIKAVEGGPMSGIRTLILENPETGGMIWAHIESGYGMRQLVNVLDGEILGRTIYFTLDDFGCIASFIPEEYVNDPEFLDLD